MVTASTDNTYPLHSSHLQPLNKSTIYTIFSKFLTYLE